MPVTPDYNEQLKSLQGAFGADSPLGSLPAIPRTSLFDRTVERLKRNSETSTGDLFGAMVHEDSPVYGMVAAHVGDQFQPDAAYNPLDPKTFAENTKGLPEEYQAVMGSAVSPQHAIYLRTRLDEKLADQQKLADMGASGHVARFLAGLLEPTNLAIGLASGGTTSLLKGASTAARLGTSFAGAGAAGAAFEAVRQKYNYEDSPGDMAWAGLMGMAFSAPFIGVHERQMANVRAAAKRELDVLNAVRAGNPSSAVEKSAQEIAAQTKALEPDYTGFPPANENGPVTELPHYPRHDAVQVSEPFTPREQAPEVNAPADTPVPSGFIEGGSVGGAQVEHVPLELTALSKARFDIAADMNKSENPVIQHIGERDVKDAIGRVDAEGNQVAQRRTTSEDKKMMQRVLGGGFHFEAQSAYKDAAKKLGYGWLSGLPSRVDGFYKLVGKALRDERIFAENPVIEPELRRAAQAARDTYSKMLGEMQASGVKGAETLAANPDYVNRVWLQHRIREAVKTHGPDTVRDLFTDAIRNKEGILARFRERNPESKLTDREVLQQSAGKFIESVMALEHSHMSTDLLLTAHDAPTLRSELKRANLSDAQANAVIDHLFEHQDATSGDKGTAAPLKYRFNLDESTRGPNGLALSDLMENDVRLLVDRYMNTMAGHVAYARRGIKSRADFMAEIRAAEENHVAAGLGTRDAKKFADQKQLALDIYDNITGRPMSMQSFNTGDRVLGALRAYGRSVYLGQLGFTASQEAFHAAGIATWRAAIQQMPALREFWQAARAGHAPTKGLVEDIRQMLGYLNEHVSGYARQHEITEHTYDRNLNRVENGANILSHAVDKMSGNSFTTSFTRGLAAGQMVQKFTNFARGKGAMSEARRNRLVGSGVNSADIEKMLAQLKDHVELEGDRVVGVKWEDWSAKDPNSYHDFLTAVDRDVRQAIQDHDLGETMLFQHSSLGKFLTELRAFNIAGHSKQFLNSAHYRDRVTLQLWTTSLLVNGLAYIVQTSANYAHSPKDLDKRLTPQRIVNAAYQRSNMMGIMPFLTDTVLPGAVNPFQGTGQGVTANTDSRNILLPPSVNLIAKGINFMQNGNPKDAVSVLPFSNTYGARNLVDMVGKAYPQPHAPSH